MLIAIFWPHLIAYFGPAYYHIIEAITQLEILIQQQNKNKTFGIFG